MSASVEKVTEVGKYVTENYNNRITHFREFEVTFKDTSDPADEPRKAMTAKAPNNGPKIPKYGEKHPFDLFSFVKTKKAEQLGPHFYRVTVGYQPHDYNRVDEDGDETEDPLSQKAEIEYFGIPQNEPIDRTIDDKPIVNSSGEPFDPPIMETKYDIGIRIRRVEKDFHAENMVLLLNTYNRDSFLGFPAETVLLEDFSAKKAYKGLVSVYWIVEYTFRFRLDGWKKRRILDQGFRVKSGNNVLPDSGAKMIVDSAGNFIAEPAMLNGSGQLSSSPCWLEFTTKDGANFDALNFNV